MLTYKKGEIEDVYAVCDFGFRLAVLQVGGAGVSPDLGTGKNCGDAAVRGGPAAAGGICGAWRPAAPAGACRPCRRRLWDFKKLRLT